MVQKNSNYTSAKKTHAYTPGLQIKKNSVVRKTRTLPIAGDVLVDKGDRVDFDTIVARATILGDPELVPVTDELGLNFDEIPKVMVKKIGDQVKKDEIIAQYVALFGLIKRFARSPIDGTIEHISTGTGRVTVRGNSIPLMLKAYIPGRVVDVMPGEGVVVETSAAFVQGIIGIGGETHGRLSTLAKSPDEVITADMINNEQEEKIIVGGSLVTIEALEKAARKGVAGIIVGGVRGVDLTKFMGYQIGVAITGDEEIGTTIVITEGFGKMAMSYKTFELLKFFDGEKAAINGETQIRAGVLRPEIIIPHHNTTGSLIPDEFAGGLMPGTHVRVIRQPYFGAVGKVSDLIMEPQKIQSESFARVLEVELENGRRVIVPRANVEIIEE